MSSSYDYAPTQERPSAWDELSRHAAIDILRNPRRHRSATQRRHPCTAGHSQSLLAELHTGEANSPQTMRNPPITTGAPALLSKSAFPEATSNTQQSGRTHQCFGSIDRRPCIYELFNRGPVILARLGYRRAGLLVYGGDQNCTNIRAHFDMARCPGCLWPRSCIHQTSPESLPAACVRPCFESDRLRASLRDQLDSAVAAAAQRSRLSAARGTSSGNCDRSELIQRYCNGGPVQQSQEASGGRDSTAKDVPLNRNHGFGKRRLVSANSFCLRVSLCPCTKHR